MKARQTLPRQWLVVAGRTRDPLGIARRLPRGSGILVVDEQLKPGIRRQLRRIAERRGLVLVEERGGAALRVHGMRELRQARLAGAELLFLSPIFPTASHPGRAPLPFMRAATLVRLARVPVIALGGMTARKFGRVAGLGFAGWAGIDAYGRKSHAVRR